MDIVVIGGCGHVGLPLAVALANVGYEVISYDINQEAVDLVNSCITPFSEENLEIELLKSIKLGFKATTDSSVIKSARVLIFIIGTPLNSGNLPDKSVVSKVISDLNHLFNDDQLIILRSTVFPGCTLQIENDLKSLNKNIDVTFCPERIAEGKAISELHNLPQIIGARSDKAFFRASELFSNLGVKIIRTTPEEAELAKLFTNAWRYLKFAIANEFWMIANGLGVNFANIHDAVTFEYPRAVDLPIAGFAAGPCLFKDTVQLSSAYNSNFTLGNSAISINQGLPKYIVERIKLKFPLKSLRVGILGMAFKAESDDIRSSLSYSLKEILLAESEGVYTHDPYVTSDSELIALDKLISQSDLLIIGAPHKIYKSLHTDKPLIDIWNLTGKGDLLLTN